MFELKKGAGQVHTRDDGGGEQKCARDHMDRVCDHLYVARLDESLVIQQYKVRKEPKDNLK